MTHRVLLKNYYVLMKLFIPYCELTSFNFEKNESTRETAQRWFKSKLVS